MYYSVKIKLLVKIADKLKFLYFVCDMLKRT